jgi:glutamate synthase (NADPH/NADH) large chain
MVNLERGADRQGAGRQVDLARQTRDGERESDEAILKRLIERHFKHTGSTRARNLLDDWAEQPRQVRQGLPDRVQARAGGDASMEEAAEMAELRIPVIRREPSRLAPRTYRA